MRDASAITSIQTMQSSTPIPSSPIHVSQFGKDEPPVLEKVPNEEQEPVEPIVIEQQPEPSTIAPSLLCQLAPTDYLVVDRRLRVKRALSLRGKSNTYLVRAEDGSEVYTVTEHSSWWSGYFLCGIRPMTLAIANAEGHEVIRLHRPFSLTTRLVPCALQRMQIFSPPETCIGSVEQLWSPVRPLYIIRNKYEEPVYGVSGPRITVHCFRDVTFKVARIQDGSVVATTSKRWLGVAHAVFMSSITGRFTINFDVTLNLEDKALVLATTILMDYMYYDI